MAIKLSQSLKQGQNLVMTPQLQQAIKMLTLTHLEMTTVIAAEMVENPMLEEIGGGDSPESEKKSEEDYKVEQVERVSAEASAENFTEKSVVEKDDFDWQSYVESFNNSSSTPSSTVRSDPEDTLNYENMVSKGESLAEHLEWQLRMESFPEIEYQFAMMIIHNINDDGYLATPFEELIADSQIERERAFDILEIVQRLDPVGCGSESLVDCLLAQARIAEERSPLLEKIIKGHLEDLRVRSFSKIAKTLGVAEEQIISTAELLKNFYPKPGRLISPQDTHYVMPDIYVNEVSGEFVVQVNDEGVPRLKVSQFYQSMLKKGAEKDEASEYVQDKLRSAMWLIKSIQNRQKTIVRVAKAIVRQQQAFFKKGPSFLKPMILKDIASEIGVHESTVSRVTTSKYMHTPIGMFELKYFFSSAVGGKGGGVEVSNEVLKIKLKKLIDNENPAKPLSDQKLAELLSREDLSVARRTIAKYREAMGIYSSSKRKIKK